MILGVPGSRAEWDALEQTASVEELSALWANANLQFICLIVFDLIFLLPCLAVWVRRLHDTGRSAWNILWVLLPIIGWIVLFVYACLDSQKGSNKYGPSEKYPNPEA